MFSQSNTVRNTAPPDYCQRPSEARERTSLSTPVGVFDQGRTLYSAPIFRDVSSTSGLPRASGIRGTAIAPTQYLRFEVSLYNETTTRRRHKQHEKAQYDTHHTAQHHGMVRSYSYMSRRRREGTDISRPRPLRSLEPNSEAATRGQATDREAARHKLTPGSRTITGKVNVFR